MKRHDRQAIKRNFEMRLQVKEKRGGDYNEFHPERVGGEVFYRNMREEEFAALALTTKRRGTVAYTAAGESYETKFKDRETRPVFVNTFELKQLKIRYK
jgi:hypothetical protein